MDGYMFGIPLRIKKQPLCCLWTDFSSCYSLIAVFLWFDFFLTVCAQFLGNKPVFGRALTNDKIFDNTYALFEEGKFSHD